MSLKRAQNFFGKLVLLESSVLRKENKVNFHDNDIERKVRIEAYTFAYTFLKTLVEKDLKTIKEIEKMFDGIEIEPRPSLKDDMKENLEELKKKL